MSTTRNQEDAPEYLVSVRKAAQLGGRNERLIYRWIEQGRIDHKWTGGRVSVTLQGLIDIGRQTDRRRRREAGPKN